MNALTDFIKTSLYPALFSRADIAFPDMRLQQYKGGWATSLKLDGSTSSPARKDKCVITRNQPTRILEQGGESKDLLSLWMERNNKTSTFEAVEALSRQIGIAPPERQSSEQWDKFCKEVEAREKHLTKMRRAIQDPAQGAEVIEYLRSHRGYSEEYIAKLIEWGIGCLTPEIASQMGDTLPRSVNTAKHQMAIPYYSGGKLYGFIFRDISGTLSGGDKYRFTYGLQKKANLFGLTGLKLSGNRDKDRTLTIVEGQLDALHAQLCGMENVVATGGVALSEESLLEAKNRGVEQVVLILDTEGDQTKDAQRDKDRERALMTIHRAGMEGFIVLLPSEGGKMDIDSYLNTHSMEQLEEVIERKERACMFLYAQLQAEAWAKFQAQKQHEVWDEINISDFKRKVLNLLSHSITSPTYRDAIIREVSAFTQGSITREALKEEADAICRAKEIEKHSDETKKLTEQASILAKAGKAEEALELLSKGLPRLSQMKRETEFSSLLNNPTEADFRAELQNKKEGIPTSYTFAKGGETEVFTIPSGAITLVCAPTSHGKSTLLQNLSLQVAQNGKDGEVIYFTFEEEESSVKLQMINKYINREITHETYKKSLNKTFNNMSTLQIYGKTGDLTYAKTEVRELLAKRWSEFFNLPIRIYRKNWDARKLRDAIAYLCKQTKVKAVFIDYIQLLRLEGYKGERRSELCDICNLFNTLAIDLSLPIVMATQLNRKAGSPLDMHAQNIAESADIERYANTLICLWNSSFKSTTESASTAKELESHQTKHGYTLGTAGKIYVKIAKNRGGIVGLEGTLDYNGNTGVMTQTKTDPLGNTFKTKSPFGL